MNGSGSAGGCPANEITDRGSEESMEEESGTRSDEDDNRGSCALQGVPLIG